MNQKTVLIMVIVLSLFLPAQLSAGPDGFMEYDWQEIRTVKGGASECTISAVDDEGFVPDTKVFFNSKGIIEKVETEFGIRKFIYDQAGRLKEIEMGYMDENKTYIPSGKTVYSYDAKGKLTGIVTTDSEGNEYMREGGISHDAKGNIKIERLTPEGSVYMIDTYTKDMYLIEELVYTGESVALGLGKKEIESTTVLKYDKDNNLLEKETNYVTVPFEGIPKKIVIKYEYKFDSKGNRISQKTTISPPESADIFSYLLTPDMKFTYKYGSDTKQTKDTTTDKKNSMVGKKVKVEWNGSWYPATILKQDGEKYLIHYDEYDESWDEWVTKDRIKF